MSPNTNKNVPQLVEKYTQKYPDEERKVLRKLIRLENKITHPSDLKKLDRYLRKAFQLKADTKENKIPEEKHGSEQNIKTGIFGWLTKRQEQKAKNHDKQLRQLQAESAITLETFELDPSEPDYFKKLHELKMRIYRDYNLL